MTWFVHDFESVRAFLLVLLCLFPACFSTLVAETFVEACVYLFFLSLSLSLFSLSLSLTLSFSLSLSLSLWQLLGSIPVRIIAGGLDQFALSPEVLTNLHCFQRA